MMSFASREVAVASRRLVADGRVFILDYWLLYHRASRGVGAYVVVCAGQEMLRDGRCKSGCVESAGAGADRGQAVAIYEALVREAVLPVHLADVVRDVRCDRWTTHSAQGAVAHNTDLPTAGAEL